jgi:ABC-type bacteriocin/lantibiotic exporter with double-glycine peptidase domain
MLRCVIVERSVAYGDAVSVHAEKMSPLARLWALLRPERSDIFVLLVFSLIVGLLALATPIAFQSMVDTVAFGRFLQPLVVLTLLLTFMSFSAAIQGLESYVVEIIQCRLFARVTADLAYRLPRVRAESRDGKYMPELVNRFFDTITVQKVSAKLLLDGLTLALNTVIGMIVLALYGVNRKVCPSTSRGRC